MKCWETSSVIPLVVFGLGIFLSVFGLAIFLSSGPALGKSCDDYSNHMHYVDNTLRGHNVQDLVLSGPYALTVGWETPFWVVDVSDPTATEPVAELELEFQQFALAVDEGLVAIAALYGEGGECAIPVEFGLLQLVDLSDPVLPRCISQLRFRTIPSDIALVGGYAYLTMGNLVVVDVTDPSVPAEVGTYPLNDAYLIATRDDYAFVVDRVGEDASVLHVVDLADPVSPQQAGSIELNWSFRDLTVDGDLVYLGGSNRHKGVGGLVVVDVSIPHSPSLVSTTELSSFVRGVGVDRGVAVLQSTLLRTFDVSRPDAPTPLGQTKTSLSARRIIVRDGYAFLGADAHGLHVFDVSSPTSAEYVHSVSAPASPQDIVIVGNLAYVVDDEDGFLVLDVSDPLSPVQIAQESIPDGAVRKKLFVSGDFAYVSSGGLQIVDLSDPLDPRLRGSTTVGEPPYAYQVVTVGDFAYLSTSDGLEIYDVTDPDDPRRQNSLVLDDYCSYLDYRDGYIYIGSSEMHPTYVSRLRVLDLRDPVNPEPIGSVEIPFGHGMVEVGDGVVYVSTRGYIDSYLTVVDITEPTAPSVLGSAHYPNELSDFLVIDGIGYGAGPHLGLGVFDLADPTDPRFLSNIPVESGAAGQTVIALGGLICLGAGGLQYGLPHCAESAAIEEAPPGLSRSIRGARLITTRPNPFNPETSIDFLLTRPQRVRVAIYDQTGRQVIVLADRHFDVGNHSLRWSGKDSFGRDVASDVYHVRLVGEGIEDTRKTLLLK